ncbi:MAG TPA: RDD family protein [Paucimonas sp.]|nr:RDD family protein [Paucimonas sp.]
MHNLYYPRLIKRVLAAQLDGVIMIVAAMASLVIGDSMGVSSLAGKAMLGFVPIFLLEPGLMALTGSTIGHRIHGLKVVKKDGVGRLNIFAATLRFVVKTMFGVLSYAFLFTTRRRQALHDLVARSVVLHRESDGLPRYDRLQERRIEEAGFTYPAAWKRILGIVLYLGAALALFGLFARLALPDACVYEGYCYGADAAIEKGAVLAMWIAFGAIIAMGWRGRLYGFRRKAVRTDTTLTQIDGNNRS